MGQNQFRWSNEQLREHVEIIDGTRSPHKLLKNATYLNSYIREWMEANIWIYDDRIIYVGENYQSNYMNVKLLIVMESMSFLVT